MSHGCRLPFWLFLCLLSSLLWAKPGEFLSPRPQLIHELGFTFAAQAHLMGGEIFVMDRELINHDYPSLAHLPDDVVKQIMVANCFYLTDDQWLWNDILMKLDIKPLGTRQAYQPLTYRRGSVAEVMPMADGPSIGLIDLKGTGLSVEGVGNFHPYRMLKKFLGGDHDREYFIGYARIAPARAAAGRAAEQRILKRIEEAEDSHSRYRAQHDLVRHREVMEEERLYEAVAQAIAQGASVTKVMPAVEALYAHLRLMDYRNALHAADRGLKEFIVDKALAKIKRQYNLRHNTNYGNVGTYFAGIMPVQIMGPRGQVHYAGVIARRAHWRSHEDEVHDIFPPQLFGDALKGANQYDVFGSQVDLELPEVRDPRVANVLRTGAIETAARQAVEAFLKGDKGAPERLAQEILAKLDVGQPPLPPAGFVERPNEPYQSLANIMESTNRGSYSGQDIQALHRQALALKPDAEQLAALENRFLLLVPSAITPFLSQRISAAPADAPEEKAEDQKDPNDDDMGTGELQVLDAVPKSVMAMLPQFGTLVKMRTPAMLEVAQAMRAKHPAAYDALTIFMAPELIRETLTAEGDAGFSDFHYGDTMHTITTGFVQLMNAALLTLADEPRLRFRPGSMKLTFPGHAPAPAEELAKMMLEGSPRLFNAMLESAERLTGGEVSESLFQFLDPQNQSRFLEFRNMERAIRSMVQDGSAAGMCLDDLAIAGMAAIRQQLGKMNLGQP